MSHLKEEMTHFLGDELAHVLPHVKEGAKPKENIHLDIIVRALRSVIEWMKDLERDGELYKVGAVSFIILPVCTCPEFCGKLT